MSTPKGPLAFGDTAHLENCGAINRVRVQPVGVHHLLSIVGISVDRDGVLTVGVVLPQPAPTVLMTDDAQEAFGYIGEPLRGGPEPLAIIGQVNGGREVLP